MFRTDCSVNCVCGEEYIHTPSVIVKTGMSWHSANLTPEHIPNGAWETLAAIRICCVTFMIACLGSIIGNSPLKYPRNKNKITMSHAQNIGGILISGENIS